LDPGTRCSTGAFSLFVAITLLLALEGASAASPITIPTATANPIQAAGQGLCVANAISTSPASDFPQGAGVFNAGINTFLEIPAFEVTFSVR
jgi:hypothetical protein